MTLQETSMARQPIRPSNLTEGVKMVELTLPRGSSLILPATEETPEEPLKLIDDSEIILPEGTEIRIGSNSYRAVVDWREGVEFAPSVGGRIEVVLPSDIRIRMRNGLSVRTAEELVVFLISGSSAMIRSNTRLMQDGSTIQLLTCDSGSVSLEF